MSPTLSSVLPVLATVAGVSMSLSPLLQIRRMLQRRSSEDVSLGYLCVLMVGFVTWLAYGLSLGNVALVVTNVASLTVSGAALAVAVNLRASTARRRAPAPPSSQPARR